MGLITDYDSLKTEVQSWLNRTDTATVNAVPGFIQLGEARLKRDRRVRVATCRGTWTINGDGDAFPSDFGSVETWEYDGPVYFGKIEVVNDLGDVKAAYGLTTAGVPRYAEIKDGRAYYAPAPSGTFTTRMSYQRKLSDLSDTNTTNWLLDDHPDVYLAAAVLEGFLWLKDEQRADYWEGKLETALDRMRRANWTENFEGGTVQRFRRPIG